MIRNAFVDTWACTCAASTSTTSTAKRWRGGSLRNTRVVAPAAAATLTAGSERLSPRREHLPVGWAILMPDRGLVRGTHRKAFMGVLENGLSGGGTACDADAGLVENRQYASTLQRAGLCLWRLREICSI